MVKAVRAGLIAICGVIVLDVFVQRVAQGHGFGERYDLPVPLYLYVLGSGAAVALSFPVISLFMKGTSNLGRYGRVNILNWSLGRILANPKLLTLFKIVSVGIYVLVIATGLFGTASPAKNLTPTIVWVIWWVGLAYFSALVGNLWILINPWRIIFEWAEELYSRVDSAGALSFKFDYPNRLGVYPAVLLFMGFAWIELVYAGSAHPGTLAQLLLAYSMITWCGMLLFGRDVWTRYGDAFSVAFGLLSKFSPTEMRVASNEVCRNCSLGCNIDTDECIDCVSCYGRVSEKDREFNIRPFAIGLLREERISWSTTVFVLLLLATVTFDGFSSTPLWGQIQVLFSEIFPGIRHFRTLALVFFPIIFIGVYLMFSTLMSVSSGLKYPVGEISRVFVYSLVPIALAYHLAHFFSFLLIQGQLLVPLASDPFGFGWNLFGTANYRIDVGIVDARLAWVTSVIFIVVGHVVAVYLAHAIAIRTLLDRSAALRSQVPMLILMVAYTMGSLWILAQPIVANE